MIAKDAQHLPFFSAEYARRLREQYANIESENLVVSGEFFLFIKKSISYIMACFDNNCHYLESERILGTTLCFERNSEAKNYKRFISSFKQIVKSCEMHSEAIPADIQNGVFVENFFYRWAGLKGIEEKFEIFSDYIAMTLGKKKIKFTAKTLVKSIEQSDLDINKSVYEALLRCAADIDNCKNIIVPMLRNDYAQKAELQNEKSLLERQRKKRIDDALQVLCEELPHLAQDFRTLVATQVTPEVNSTKITPEIKYLICKQPIKKLSEEDLKEVAKIAKKYPWRTRNDRKISPFRWISEKYKVFIPGLTQTNVHSVDQTLYFAFLRMISREKNRLESEGKVEAADGLPPWLDVPADKDLVLRGRSDAEVLRILTARETNRTLAALTGKKSPKSERPEPLSGFGQTRAENLTQG